MGSNIEQEACRDHSAAIRLRNALHQRCVAFDVSLVIKLDYLCQTFGQQNVSLDEMRDKLYECGMASTSGTGESPLERDAIEALLEEIQLQSSAITSNLPDPPASFQLPAQIYFAIRSGSLAECRDLLKSSSKQSTNSKEKFSDTAISDEIFQHIANALIELRLRHIDVSADIELYLQTLLCGHAYTRLATGITINTQATADWRQHLDAVCETWGHICANCDLRTYDGVDSKLLQWLRIIHNNLHFLQSKPWIRSHLPMVPLMRCLALFIAIFRYGKQYEKYRLLLNKRNVLRALEVTCRNLTVMRGKFLDAEQKLASIYDDVQGTYFKNSNVQNKDEAREKLLALVEQIVDGTCKSETVVDQLMQGLVKKKNFPKVFDSLVSCESNALFDFRPLLNRSDSRIFKDLSKCFTRVQALHSIEKILGHLDMAYDVGRMSNPPKLLQMYCIKRMLQTLGEYVKNTKQTPNMPYSVLNMMKHLLSETFFNNAKGVREHFSHEFSLNKLQLNLARESTFLHRVDCERLRALCQVLYLQACYQCIQKFCSTLLQSCQSLESVTILMDYLGAVADIESSLIAMTHAVYEYFDGKLSSWRTRKSTNDSATFTYFTKVRLLLHIFLTFNTVGDFASLQQIRQSLSVLPLADSRNLLIAKVRNIRHINLYVFGSCFYVSKELLEDPVTSLSALHSFVTAPEGIDELEMAKTFRKLNVPKSSAVSRDLKSYYEDVFRSEKKYSILQGFATEEIEEMKRKDQTALQAHFDDRRAVLRGFFQLFNCDTVDGLIANYGKIPAAAVAAMELCQLELCIILKSVGRFGENVGYLKCGVPIVSGRNYRNYLAHGALCYSILTDTTESLVVLANGLVLATTPTELFLRSRKASYKFCFPSGKEMLDWVNNSDVVAIAAPMSAMPFASPVKLQSFDQPLLHSILPFYNDLSTTRVSEVSPLMAEPSLNALLLEMLKATSGSCCTPFERWMLAYCKVMMKLHVNTFYNRIQNNLFNNTLIAFRSTTALRQALQASGISMDVLTALNSNGYSSTPFLVLLSNRSVKTLQQLPLPQRQAYRAQNDFMYPLSCAMGQRNGRRLAYLKRNGFTYLDNPNTLKSAIVYKRDDVVQEILLSLTERSHSLAVACTDAYTLEIVKVLNAWRVIGFLEQPSVEQLLALHLAIFENNEQLVQRLLDTSRTARTIVGLGVAHEIAFDCRGVRSSFSSNRPEDFLAMLKLCDSMVTIIEERHLPGDTSWQLSSVSCAGSTIHLRTPERFDQTDHLHLLSSSSKLNSLPKVMDKLLSICQEHSVAYGFVRSKSDEVKYYFFKSHQMVCAFSVLPLEHTVSLKALVNFKDADGQTPLWCTFQHWNTNICELLLKYGADPVGLLHTAIVNNANFAKTLLKHCVQTAPDVLELPCSRGKWPIHYAAYAEDDSIMAFLVDSGVDVKAKDKYGWTAAMHCVDRGKLTQLKLLLDREPVLLEIDTNEGHTLLHVSALSPVGALDVLLPLRPRFEHRTAAGDSPVAVALQYENRPWLKRVFEHFEETGEYPVTVRELEDMRSLAIRMQDLELLSVADVQLARISNELKLFISSHWSELTKSRTPEHKEFDLCLQLLSKWKVFAILETKWNDSRRPLCHAIELKDVALTESVLGLAKQVRTVLEHGFTNEVAFHRQDKTSVFGQENHTGLGEMLTDFREMFEHLDNATLSSMDWKESKIPCANKGTIHVFTQSGNCSGRRLGRLQLKSTKLETWVTKLHEAAEGHFFACATIESTDNEIKYCFIKVDQYACAFDIVPPTVPLDLKHFVNSATSADASPLWCCVQSWHPQICHLLLENGADPTQIDAGTQHRAPLHWAVANNAEIARTFLEHSHEGTAAAETPSAVGKRPIHYAACAADDDILRYLVDRGVDLKAQDGKGRTAAMFCVAKNHPSRLAILLANDPELLEMRDNRGLTLLHYSAFHGGCPTLPMLLPMRPNFSRGTATCSALELAIHDKHVQWIKDALAYWNSESHTEDHSDDAGMWGPTVRELRAIRAFADEALDNELSRNVAEYVARMADEIRVFADALERKLASIGTASHDSELAFCINALKRWHVLGLLHRKWRQNQTPLGVAVEMENVGLVEKLLQIEKCCQTVEPTGVLSEIVVDHVGEVSHFDLKSIECHPEPIVRALEAIENILQTTVFAAEPVLRLNDSAVCIFFPIGVMSDVPKARDDHSFDTPAECLTSLLQICKRQSVAYAAIMQKSFADSKKYFIKTESWACVFNVTHPQVDNLRNGRRTQLLWSSLGSGHWDICRLLLENGADPTMISETKKWAPIHWVAANNTELARTLLDYCLEKRIVSVTGESILEVCDVYGDRLIHVAALHGNGTDLMKYLINRGATVTAQNSKGHTAAMFAISKNFPLKLRLLLERDPELVGMADTQGHMLHHISAQYPVEFLSILLPWHPDFARKTNAGRSALAIALHAENIPWIKLMLTQVNVDTFLSYGELETMTVLADGHAEVDLRQAVSALLVKMYDRLDKLADKMRLVYPDVRELHDANLSWLVRTLGNTILAIGKELAVKHCQAAACSESIKVDHNEMKKKWLQLDEEFSDSSIAAQSIQDLVTYRPDSVRWLERESGSSLDELFTRFEIMLQTVKSSKILQSWNLCRQKPRNVIVKIFTQNPLAPEMVDSNESAFESLESSVKYLFSVCDSEPISYAIVQLQGKRTQHCFLKAGANGCIFSTPSFSFVANKKFELNVRSLWDIDFRCCNRT